MKAIKRLIAVAAIALAVSACGTEVRYVTLETTEAPTTTQKATTTTQAPRTTVPYKSDTDWFIDAIYEVMGGRVYVSDTELLETGFLVCQSFDMGLTATDVMLAMYESASYGTSAQELLAAVTVGATTFLCPEWSWVWETLP